MLNFVMLIQPDKLMNNTTNVNLMEEESDLILLKEEATIMEEETEMEMEISVMEGPMETEISVTGISVTEIKVEEVKVEEVREISVEIREEIVTLEIIEIQETHLLL